MAEIYGSFYFYNRIALLIGTHSLQIKRIQSDKCTRVYDYDKPIFRQTAMHIYTLEIDQVQLFSEAIILKIKRNLPS